MKIQNPKFKFTEEQTLKILEAANYLNKAADCVMEINGMLTSILNAISLDLLDQIGLSEELASRLQPQQTLKITDAEKAEIDELIDTLNSQSGRIDDATKS